MNMTTNLDTHVCYLDDADLHAVSGGEGYVADAAAHAALGVLYSGALASYGNNEYMRWFVTHPPCY
jgi:hypothetical protein